MRKLKLQLQMTLDGFVAGPNGEMDWMTLPWTDDINQYVTEIFDPVDTIVLGRKLAEGFIPYWTRVAEDQNHAEQQAGENFIQTSKVVFSKTLTGQAPKDLGWKNTNIAKGDLIEEIHQMKKQRGGDIYACGGASFASALVRHGLVDDFYLFINPVAIGKGMPIFQEIESRQAFERKNCTSFDCGIIGLHYIKKVDRQEHPYS